MFYRHHIRSVGALIVTGLILVACSSSEPAVEDSEDPGALSIQVGDNMTFADGRISFTSNGKAHWFTERPAREVGSTSLQELTSLWDDGRTFSDDPPNAAVLIDDEEPIVIELLDIEVSGETVTYDTKTLLGTVPATGNRITLVIDHLCMFNPADCQ